MQRRENETDSDFDREIRTYAAHHRKNSRRRLGSFCIILGSLMLAAAVVLLAYNVWDDWRAGNSVAAVQEALESAKEERAEETAESFYYNMVSGAGLIAEDNADADGAEMAVIEIDGYDYIGTLSVTRYGLELPIMSEWSYAGLKIAPGRYSGSVKTNDLVICGHNYERHFGNLKYLEAGDTINFTDVDGNVYYYVVDEVITLQPTDIEEMVSEGGTAWDLTLFTCTVGGQARVTVRCSRITMVQ